MVETLRETSLLGKTLTKCWLFITGPVKTRHICADYACSEFGTFLVSVCSMTTRPNL